MRCVMCRSSLPGMGKPGLVVAQVQGSPARNVYVPVWVMVSWGRRGRHVQEQCVAHPCVVWENSPMVVVRVQGPPCYPIPHRPHSSVASVPNIPSRPLLTPPGPVYPPGASDFNCIYFRSNISGSLSPRRSTSCYITWQHLHKGLL